MKDVITKEDNVLLIVRNVLINLIIKYKKMEEKQNKEEQSGISIPFHPIHLLIILLFCVLFNGEPDIIDVLIQILQKYI